MIAVIHPPTKKIPRIYRSITAQAATFDKELNKAVEDGWYLVGDIHTSMIPTEEIYLSILLRREGVSNE